MLEPSNVNHEWHVSNRKVIAYVRACDEMALGKQYNEIDRFAKEHKFEIVETFCDVGAPMSGLRYAMEALERADALIVCNLNRFVTHRDDRLRDLRPILHHFCSRESSGKHLISIEEGVNTATVAGQMNALELINELKDSE